MAISPYRLRLKLREAKRDYPMISLIEFTFNLIVSFAVLAAVSFGLYYALATIAPH